jgi:hypothetical protein
VSWRLLLIKTENFIEIKRSILVQGLLVIALCNIVTIITAISMSAVSTNGQIKAGGQLFTLLEVRVGFESLTP